MNSQCICTQKYGEPRITCPDYNMCSCQGKKPDNYELLEPTTLLIDETYGVYLTPHFEKYQVQNQETSDIMHETWNFGNALKGKGITVAYLHGPLGIYEGAYLDAKVLELSSEDHVKEFIEAQPKDDTGEPIKMVFFLYQKLPNRIKYQYLQKRYIEEMRKQRKECLNK